MTNVTSTCARSGVLTNEVTSMRDVEIFKATATALRNRSCCWSGAGLRGSFRRRVMTTAPPPVKPVGQPSGESEVEHFKQSVEETEPMHWVCVAKSQQVSLSWRQHLSDSPPSQPVSKDPSPPVLMYQRRVELVEDAALEVQMPRPIRKTYEKKVRCAKRKRASPNGSELAMVGDAVGPNVGREVLGAIEGRIESEAVGLWVGPSDGALEGVGPWDGALEGAGEGCAVGTSVGKADGWLLGVWVGLTVGELVVGIIVGATVGVRVGVRVGVAVGGGVGAA